MDIAESLIIANLAAKGRKVQAGGPGSGRRPEEGEDEDEDDYKVGEKVHHKDQFGNEIGEATVKEVDKSDENRNNHMFLLQHTADGSKIWDTRDRIGRGLGKINKNTKK